jgi:hypothetical protein
LISRDIKQELDELKHHTNDFSHIVFEMLDHLPAYAELTKRKSALLPKKHAQPILRRSKAMKPYAAIIFMFFGFLLTSLTGGSRAFADSITPPAQPVRLIFIHHSTGEGWLADDNGGLGVELRDNNYFVSDTNYDWGPADQDAGSGTIGDHTDIGNWYSWFRGPNSATYLSALYDETEQHASYSRLATNPGGENEIIMFKSCFPNSALQGSPGDPVPAIGSNPLKGQSAGGDSHTVANAKGIYIDLLQYFTTRKDKLFIVIAAPPLIDSTYAANARSFNNWLVNDWLSAYPHSNVFVFDFYNVLTTNGGLPSINDLKSETGNHHRWWNNAVQHKTDGDNDVSPNVLEYPTGDDHPSRAGNLKATAEFVPLLNLAYNRWKDNGTTTTTTIGGSTTTTTVSGRKCPARSVLGENYSYLENLRDFRDSTLAQSAMGRKAIQIYYNNADSITAALEKSPSLRAVSRRVLEVISPMLKTKEN